MLGRQDMIKVMIKVTMKSHDQSYAFKAVGRGPGPGRLGFGLEWNLGGGWWVVGGGWSYIMIINYNYHMFISSY